MAHLSGQELNNIETKFNKLKPLGNNSFIYNISEDNRIVMLVIADKELNKTTVIIPRNITEISNRETPIPHEYICDTVEIIGGEKLKAINFGKIGLLREKRIKTLNLCRLHTDNLENLYGAFSNMSSDTIIFGDFNTSNVVCIDKLFCNSSITELNMKSIDTSKVISARKSFGFASFNKLLLGGMNTQNIRNTKEMFYYSTIKELVGLEEMNVANSTEMDSMFRGMVTPRLDISTFKFNYFANVSSLLQAAIIDELYIDYIIGIENMEELQSEMFRDTRVNSKLYTHNGWIVKKFIEQSQYANMEVINMLR